MVLFACMVLLSVLLSSRRVRAALPGEAGVATQVAAAAMMALLVTGNLA